MFLLLASANFEVCLRANVGSDWLASVLQKPETMHGESALPAARKKFKLYFNRNFCVFQFNQYLEVLNWFRTLEDKNSDSYLILFSPHTYLSTVSAVTVA